MKANAPYWCHNQPRPAPDSTYPIQVGWTADGRRLLGSWPVLQSVAECRYDKHGTDPRCDGCRFIKG